MGDETRAVILAAGRGRRLEPMGWNKPKCLLEFGGRTLLARMLDAIASHGIRRIVVVVGYQRALVEEEAARSVSCMFVENRAFETTNTIHSLWLALAHLGDDYLYFNADILFDPAIVTAVLSGRRTRLAVDVKPCGSEEVKVIVDAEDRITRIGKTLPVSSCLGEFIGIARFTDGAATGLADALRRYNEQPRQRDLFFEAALDDITGDHELWAERIGDRRAVEIDTPDDVRRAATLWE
jgi:choline kinase